MKLKENINNFLKSRQFLGYNDTMSEQIESLWDGTQIFTSSQHDIVVVYTNESLRKKECLIMVNWKPMQTYKHKILIGSSISKQSSLMLINNRIEFVSKQMIQFKRNNHKFVPRYIILAQDEICKRFKCELSCFPIILSSDPQVIYLGAKKGTVLYNQNDNIYRVVQDRVL